MEFLNLRNTSGKWFYVPYDRIMLIRGNELIVDCYDTNGRKPLILTLTAEVLSEVKERLGIVE